MFVWRKEGVSFREIGRRLGRDHTSLSDELKNNINYGNEYFGNTYLPCKAQELSDKRALKQRRKAPLKEPLIFLYVREHIRGPFNWTPEQIAGTLPLDHPGYSISTETIYSYIYSRKAKPYKLWKLLVHRRKKRMKKLDRRIRRDGKIKGSISIDLRPKYIQKRVQVGHWETDNMIGKLTDKTALSVSVERVTRLVLLSLTKRSAQSKTDHLTKRLLEYPQTIRRTLTTDNGKENSYHQRITATLNLAVFFCHSYASWEKGTVENTNGRIRRYIPKGVSMDQISVGYIKEVERRINSTPRKCLGYLTPYEMMTKVLKK